MSSNFSPLYVSGAFLGTESESVPRQSLWELNCETEISCCSQQELESFLQKITPAESWVVLIPFSPISAKFPAIFRSFHSPMQVDWHSFSTNNYPLQVNWGHELKKFRQSFAQAKKLISLGELYEVNFCVFLDIIGEANPYALWKNSGFAPYFVQWPQKFLSYSPELFVEVSWQEKGAQITVEPMKGTLPKNFINAQEALQFFSTQKKLSAELRLITDMCRNDLAKISSLGSLTTAPLLLRETSYAWQAVSKTTSLLKKNQSHSLQWLSSLLPAASISGAPKISATHAIALNEASSRGYYTGIFGVLHAKHWVSSVLIRTLMQKSEQKYSYGVGCGLVWESELEEEIAELKIKAGFLQKF